MSSGETRAFEREPYYREAVRVRRWDDQGKVAGLATPPLEAYLELLDAAAQAR
jgi:predicted HD phosphohydrolase